MPAADVNIRIDQGEDWSRVYQYVDPYGTYIVMSPPGAFVLVAEDGTPIYQLTSLYYEPGVALGGFPGTPVGNYGEQVRVALPRTITAELPAGKWRYAVTVSVGGANGQVTPLVRGWAVVRAAAGRLG